MILSHQCGSKTGVGSLRVKDGDDIRVVVLIRVFSFYVFGSLLKIMISQISLVS